MQLSEIKDKSVFCWGSRGSKYCRHHGKIGAMDGMQVPVACLRTQVTTGAMQWLLAAWARGKLVRLGHSGACAWGQSPPCCSQTPLLPVSSELPPPCARCPLPADKEPWFSKT